MSDSTWEFEDNNVIKLDDFQQELADAVLQNLDTTGQCGLEVMTSGGKSYIAAYIITEYLNYHSDKCVLWFGPKTACKNVKSKVLDKLPAKNRIKYIHYEEVARSKNTAQDVSDVELVIFDECHRAYAVETFKGITNILNEIPNVDRLAMSATPVRMGGKNTFEVLVPKAKPETYIKFDITEAAQHDMLPDIKYVLANMKISSADFRFVAKFKDIADKNEEARKLYNEVIDTLHGFNFDLSKDLGKMLAEKMHSHESDGAERHIAFFSNIAHLSEMRSGIKKAFEEAYPHCKVNILEFHSKLSDAENAESFKKFVEDEPMQGEIDVMLSVDKATESIHPENIKSILMFRGTQSVRIYLQQIGRGVMLKQFHPDGITIFDFAENIQCFGNPTILSGTRAVGDRTRFEATDEETVEAVRRAIMSVFGYTKGFTTELGINEIKACVDKLNSIHDIQKIGILKRNVAKIRSEYNVAIQNGYAKDTNNFYAMAEFLKIDAMADIRFTENEAIKRQEQIGKIIKAFGVYQKIYLANELDRDKNVVEYFDSIGHTAYLTASERDQASSYLVVIDKIAAEIDKNGDISECSNYAKGKLKELRRLYLGRKIGNGVRVYALYKGVDISMQNITERELNALAESDDEKTILKEYKYLIKLLKSTDENITFSDWIKVSAVYTILRYKYSCDFSITCNKYIESNYYSQLFQYKIHSSTQTKCKLLLNCIHKMTNGEIISGIEEEYLYKSSWDTMEAHEKAILNYYDIKRSDFKGFLDRTEFNMMFISAKYGNEDAIKKIEIYKSKVTDDTRKKMLNSTAFKAARKNVSEETSVTLILASVKEMCEHDKDYSKQRAILNEALNSGKITEKDIAVACFNTMDAELAREYFDKDINELEEMLKDEKLSNPKRLLLRCANSNTDVAIDIIKNIMRMQKLSQDIKDKFKLFIEASEAL